MLGGVGHVLSYLVSFALGIALPALIVRRDVARLSGEQLARSWPDSSLWSAVVAFGPLCLPVHFLRTRRSWAGLDLAAFWTGGTIWLVSLSVQTLARVFGIAE
jgi:hypothetical protein